jgi:alcohol dehydrogenase class IV
LAVVRVHELLEELNFPHLSEIGLTNDDIPMVARLALGNACTPDDPCISKEGDFVRILEGALSEEQPV